MPDPRKRRGRRHPLPAILAIAVCAVIAGACSFVAIAEWAAAANPVTLAKLGVTEVPFVGDVDGAVFLCADVVRDGELSLPLIQGAERDHPAVVAEQSHLLGRIGHPRECLS